MNVLAIYSGHNSTVCLLRDGKIEAVVSEEKFSNKKNDSSFPRESIQWIGKEYEIDYYDAIAVVGEYNVIREEDKYVIGTIGRSRRGNWASFIDQLIIALYLSGIGRIVDGLRAARYRMHVPKMQRQFVSYLRDRIKLRFDKCVFVNHHDCHAYASYFGLRSDNSPSLVITLDGQGDLVSSRAYRTEGKQLTIVAESGMQHSLGELYSKVTALLGMKPMEHEYKVMGLAAYVTEEKHYATTLHRIFKDLVRVDPKTLSFKSRFPMHLVERYLAKRMPYERFDNVAAALQINLESLVTEWVKGLINRHGVNRIFTGGGVFMNVKLNKRLQELPEVGEISFMPSSGDESTPIGAAYKVYIDATGKEPTKISDIYWGPAYSNDEITEFFRVGNNAVGLSIAQFEDIEEEVAKLLADGHIVARFQGRAEWGARSLGNRAILARPDRYESFLEINDQIKVRDFWMPFAPTILSEHADKYLVRRSSFAAPYMITSFNSTDEGKRLFRAAMHARDHSLRAQILERTHNPRYYRLIESFFSFTGIGGVLNTSFNLHGYPLVATPDQAISTFRKSGLRYLAIENCLVHKT